MEKPVVVGRLGAVYGIKGWLKVHSFTDNAESIFEYAPWLIEQNGVWREIRISGWRRHNNGLVCKLEGIDQREEAQALAGVDIAVDASWKASTSVKKPRLWLVSISPSVHKTFLSCQRVNSTGVT